MFRVGPVRKPYEGCPPPACGQPRDRGGTKLELIETVGRRAVGPQGSAGKARDRRLGEIPTQAPAASPGRVKPRGASVGRRAKPTAGLRDLRQGQSPGTAACRAGPARERTGTTAGETVGGFIRVETPGDLSAGQAPKGQSQERRRCETKPAGDRREQAVKRVAKP
jgi:hypothetical protein